MSDLSTHLLVSTSGGDDDHLNGCCSYDGSVPMVL
jgi:hypothetical protein